MIQVNTIKNFVLNNVEQLILLRLSLVLYCLKEYKG